MRQPVHFENVCSLGCGLLHDEQHTGGGGAVAVSGAVVGLPSCSSSILRFLIAVSSPSFAALGGDNDEAVDGDCVVVGSFLSLSPSFLGRRGGGDEVVVVVVVVVINFLSISFALFVAFFSCTNRRCSS